MLETDIKIFDIATDALLLDQGFPAIAGITNSLAGDFGYSDLAHEFRADRLLTRKICGEYHGSKLVPSHGSQVIFSEEFHGHVAADGLILLDRKRRPGLLTSITADCPTIVFATNDLLGIVHSGWKGCQAKIAEKAVARIKKQAQVRAREIFAGIFPGICGKCYAVKDDVGKLFRKHYSGGKLDLYQIVRRQLKHAGIKSSKIFAAPYCSCCTEKDGSFPFYSVRRDGTKFRNAVFLTWKR